MQGIYAIVNLENGKFYIGSSTNILGRLWNHLSSLRHNKEYFSNGQAILQKAWNKYGEDSFAFCPVEIYTGDDFERDRDALEQKYLDFYWPSGLLYNISNSAKHPPIIKRSSPYPKGWKRSEESTRKSIETRRKNGNLARTDETREKLRQAHLGKKQSPEAIKKAKETYKRNLEQGLHPQSKAYQKAHGTPPISKPALKGRKIPKEVTDKAKETFKKNRAAGKHKDPSANISSALQRLKDSGEWDKIVANVS